MVAVRPLHESLTATNQPFATAMLRHQPRRNLLCQIHPTLGELEQQRFARYIFSTLTSAKTFGSISAVTFRYTGHHLDPRTSSSPSA